MERVLSGCEILPADDFWRSIQREGLLHRYDLVSSLPLSRMIRIDNTLEREVMVRVLASRCNLFSTRYLALTLFTLKYDWLPQYTPDRKENQTMNSLGGWEEGNL